jgi:hypothetical protein
MTSPTRPAVPYTTARSGSALATAAVTLSAALRRDAETLPEREWRQLAVILDRLDEGAISLQAWSRRAEQEATP